MTPKRRALRALSKQEPLTKGRERRGKDDVQPLVFTTQPGHYRVATCVTDVFGNDGIATVNVEVR
jgi:hypothetical protein